MAKLVVNFVLLQNAAKDYSEPVRCQREGKRACTNCGKYFKFKGCVVVAIVLNCRLNNHYDSDNYNWLAI